MARVDQETVEVFKVGHTVVGTSAVQLATKSLSNGNMKGILVKAHGTDDTTPNTGVIHVGINDSVTADLDAETGGFPLALGESIVIPLTDPSKIFVIATDADQNISWMLV